MSYRRYKRYRRRSTNIIKMKFQSFMDISTTASSMQIITISAGGPSILRRLSPQFGAYKYYKIGNISVKLVPASTLPVDPTGLSVAVGDNLVDPRDQLTPGMMRITNGEDVFENISGLSDDQQHDIYNNMLLDPRWYKWMLQSGVKRHATPRYWQIGQLHQDKWPGANINYPIYDTATSEIVGTGTSQKLISETSNVLSPADGTAQERSIPYGFFQTGHRGVLGWLPTDGMAINGQPFLTAPPEVEVMKILLPKAYKTRYWYRAFITETVYFKDPIVNFGINATNSLGTVGSYRPLDVFHVPGVSTPREPTNIWTARQDQDSYTGGNYGDD